MHCVWPLAQTGHLWMDDAWIQSSVQWMNVPPQQRVAGWVSASIFLSPSEYWLRLKLPTKMEFQAIEQLDNGHSLLVLHGPQLQ